MSVTNLTAGDHLNVRADSSAGSEDLGDLKQGALVEVIAVSSDGKWGKFIWEEANGWAAMRYLADTPRTRSASGMPLGLQCAGTEPFWSADMVTDASFKFEAPDGVSAMTGLEIVNVPDGYDLTMGKMSGNLRPQECSDGMSDRDYGWSLDIILEGGFELKGCCQHAFAVTR